MCYYYKHIYDRDDRYDEFYVRLARQQEYERQHPHRENIRQRPEQMVRCGDDMPF
jgi:hypothetical protein